MATNYDKYINSTGTHYISNSGSDENGRLYEGKAGDQTGKEWRLRSWYARPWTCVLRHPDKAVREMIAEFAIDAALNDLIGYDQYQRYSYWARLQEYGYRPANIRTACEADCTAGVTANVKAIGHLLGMPELENIEKDTRSTNMRKRFKAAGFTVLTDSKYVNGYSYLLPGDILLYDNHHAATNVTRGKNATETPVSSKLGDRTLKDGDNGNDVKQLQSGLLKLGYDLGKWGADGDFGDMTEMAVRSFQRDNGLSVDGIFGKDTYIVFTRVLANAGKVDSAKNVKIWGGQCYVRTEPNTSGTILGVATINSEWAYQNETADNGWLKIDFNGKTGWVSGKYGKLVD